MVPSGLCENHSEIFVFSFFVCFKKPEAEIVFLVLQMQICLFKRFNQFLDTTLALSSGYTTRSQNGEHNIVKK